MNKEEKLKALRIIEKSLKDVVKRTKKVKKHFPVHRIGEFDRVEANNFYYKNGVISFTEDNAEVKVGDREPVKILVEIKGREEGIFLDDDREKFLRLLNLQVKNYIQDLKNCEVNRTVIIDRKEHFKTEKYVWAYAIGCNPCDLGAVAIIRSSNKPLICNCIVIVHNSAEVHIFPDFIPELIEADLEIVERERMIRDFNQDPAKEITANNISTIYVNMNRLIYVTDPPILRPRFLDDEKI